MNKTHRPVRLSRSVGFLFALALAASTAYGSTRPSKPCANPITDMVIAYGDHITCSTSAITEQDLYRFVGTTGEWVALVILGPDDYYNNTCADLMDPQGNSVWSGCRRPSYSASLTKSGQYTIRMWENGSNQLMNYSFLLDRVYPYSTLSSQLPYGVAVGGSLRITPDYDYYLFDVQAGNRIRIDVTGPDDYYNHVCIGLYQWTTAANPAALGSGCRGGTHLDITFQFTGTVQLQVYENGANQTADYVVQLTCMFGTCRNEPLVKVTASLTGCTTCTAGNTFSARVQIDNRSTPPRASELKVGFYMPDGTPIALGDPHIELPEGFTFDGELARGTITPSLAKGSWKFCARVLENALGEVRGVDCQAFTIQ